jgi:hypothetical protein
MPTTPSGSEIRKLILVPAVISLGVTLLRLAGELAQWSPTLFSRAGGGGGALIGISWLIPLFGIYFAMRLVRMGHPPPSRGRAIGFALLGVGVAAVLLFGATKVGPSVANVVLSSLAMALGGLVAYLGWPALGKTELVYGLAARIPVAFIMLIAMTARWGTHYEVGPPGLPEMALLPEWIVIGLIPQLFLWIGLTVMAGSLCGSLAALIPRRQA